MTAREPVLVTLKLVRGCPSLRHTRERKLLHDALRAGKERWGMRLIHFTIQSNHLHALVEARDARSLSRGMQGLCVRIARGMNRLWNRSGRVFADRFHSRVLRTPREVRYALAYVVNNARKHGLRVAGIDPYSSGEAFDGWKNAQPRAIGPREALRSLVAPARSWLLTVGWRRHGLIRVAEVPGGST